MGQAASGPRFRFRYHYAWTKHPGSGARDGLATGTYR